MCVQMFRHLKNMGVGMGFGGWGGFCKRNRIVGVYLETCYFEKTIMGVGGEGEGGFFLYWFKFYSILLLFRSRVNNLLVIRTNDKCHFFITHFTHYSWVWYTHIIYIFAKIKKKVSKWYNKTLHEVFKVNIV